jgi:protein-S-isoprenylcysteine O-methyltransferase Ste14
MAQQSAHKLSSLVISNVPSLSLRACGVSPLLLQLVIRIVCNVSVYGLLLFLPAWTVHWWRAWVVVALLFAGMLITRLWAFGGKELLLDDRRKSPLQPGQPFADKILVVGFVIIFPAYIAFIPIDVFHLHVLKPPNEAISGFGLALMIIGWLVISLAFRENAFAASIVKPQDDRGQHVVESGVYGIVRHPLYAGVALGLIGAALWLQSYAAAIVWVVPMALLIARILVEEAFLRQRLTGYAAYAQRVNHRLIPLIW